MHIAMVTGGFEGENIWKGLSGRVRSSEREETDAPTKERAE